MTEILEDNNRRQAVINNVLCNEPYAEKLPSGVEPKVAIFLVQNEGDGKLFYKNQDEIFKGHSELFLCSRVYSYIT